MRGVWVSSPPLLTSGDYTFQVTCRFSNAGFTPEQMMLSEATKDNVRGVHWYTAGQTKLVTCVSGAIWDVAVDLRPDSPTFRQWEAVRLDDHDRRVVVLGPGIGHGFCVLSEKATLVYAISPLYDPKTESSIHPLDPTLAIPWPTDSPWLSPRDTNAPSFHDVFGDVR